MSSSSDGNVDVNAGDTLKAYAYCAQVTRLSSATFPLAASLGPDDVRDRIFALYAFCRALDEATDGDNLSLNESKQKIDKLERDLRAAFSDDDNAALANCGCEAVALADTVRRTPSLSMQPFEEMIQGMRSDLRDDVRFNTWDDDLRTYCYRVAGVVGLMCVAVLGTKREANQKDAQEAAVDLGIALQLVNVIRDVGEDARERRRLYLPLASVNRVGLAAEELFSSEYTPDERYERLVEGEIQRALLYFRRSLRGLPALPLFARIPTMAAADIYGALLAKVRMNGYDNLSQRAYTTSSEKILALPGILLRAIGRTPTLKVCGDSAYTNWLAKPEPARSLVQDLLVMVELSNKSDDDHAVEAAAKALECCNPCTSPARDSLLLGEWELVWSSPGSDFARLERRLRGGPLEGQAKSLQEIGNGYSRNVVVFPGDFVRVVITATVDADSVKVDTTNVGPPYTFELQIAGISIPLKFPAEFAQERTCLRTLYLDEDLKISRVGAFGERTTEGSLFVHVRRRAEQSRDL